MSTETDFFESIFRTPTRQFTDTLDMLSLIDIGTIDSVDVNGRATVTLNRVARGAPIQLKDIEVISIGNNSGAFTVDGAGCACLLFAPKTTIPNTKERKVDWTSPSYSKGGIKALPISNGRDLLVNACFSSDGSLNVSTADYSLNFSKDLVSLTEQSGLSMQINKESEIAIYRRTQQSGILRFSVTNEGVYFSFSNTQNTSVYRGQLQDSGIFTFSHVKPGSEEKVLNEISIADDGSLTITAPGNISVSIEADGNITLKTDGTINVSASSINFNNGHLEIS